MRRFAATVMFLGLSCTAAQAAVQAQTGAWVVGPINLEAGPSTFCSMKNGFAGGATVVLARNTGGADSIAIDFGGKTLQAGHPYTVRVAAGQAERSISAVGATQSVLLINLSDDRNFYAALGKAPALHLSALNRDYDFSMTGSGDALQALQDCVDALAAGKKTAPAAAATARAAPEKNDGLSAEVKKLRADNAALSKKAAVADKSAALAAQNTKLQKELSTTKDALETQGDLSRQVKEEDARALASLKHEIARLQEKQAASPSPQAARELPAPAPKPGLDQALAAAHAVPADAQSRKTADGVVYNWQAGDLYASALKTPAQGRSFGGLVSDYFGRMAGRCGGDFAHTADVPQATGGGMIVEKAEMACVDDKNNASAALLFVGDDKNFVVITREGTQAQMEVAIAGRNAVAAAVTE